VESDTYQQLIFVKLRDGLLVLDFVVHESCWGQSSSHPAVIFTLRIAGLIEFIMTPSDIISFCTNSTAPTVCST
jgi:hypothetical protein